MKNMLKSRKYAIIILLIVALFFMGAVLGSYISKATLYLIIATVAIAAAILIVFGYTGHADYKEKKKELWSSSKTEEYDDGIL